MTVRTEKEREREREREREEKGARARATKDRRYEGAEDVRPVTHNKFEQQVRR